MPHTLLLTFSSSICDEETRSTQSKHGMGETWISAMLSWCMDADALFWFIVVTAKRHHFVHKAMTGFPYVRYFTLTNTEFHL